MRAMFSQYLLVPCLVSTFKFAVLKKKEFTLTEGMRAMFSQYFRSALKKKHILNQQCIHNIMSRSHWKLFGVPLKKWNPYYKFHFWRGTSLGYIIHMVHLTCVHPKIGPWHSWVPLKRSYAVSSIRPKFERRNGTANLYGRLADYVTLFF